MQRSPRVAGSKLFEKSARSRELLNFLDSSGGEEEPLSEQRIGVAVFGREPGYDTAVDTIARVQVSQLRKKLREYFSSEGADERIVIDIPLGSYVLSFQLREPAAQMPAPALGRAAPPRTAPSRRWKYISGAAIAILCGLLIWALVTREELKTAPPVAGEP